MKRFFAASIFMLAISHCFAQSQIDKATLDSFFKDYLKKYMGSQISSASLVFVKGDSVIYKASLGYAKPLKKILADPDSTVYQIGSNSKLFVATAAMQLYEQGKLDLHADINKYLKDIQIDNPFGEPVTMAHLLTHTSGVDDRKIGRTQAHGEKLMTLGEFFKEFPPKFSYRPGDQFNYSGTSATLAAHVIEEITGKPFYEYVEAHIYAPLQMSHSSFRQPLQSNLLNARAAMPNLPLLIKYPEGGMASTVDDMAHFLIAHLNGGSYRGEHLLKPETENFMKSRHFSAAPGMPGMGYGFLETNINGHTVWMHTGDYQHTSVLCIVPDLKLAFFFVMNTAAEIKDPVLTGFVGAVFKKFFPAAPSGSEKQNIVGNDLSKFEGYYTDNSVPQHGLEKFLFGMFFSSGEARIIYDQTKKKLLFEPPGATDKFELQQTDTLTFKADDGRFGLNIALRQKDNVTNLFIVAGPLGEYSMTKIPWIDSQVPQFIFHLGALFLFGVWLIVALVRIIINKVKKRKGKAVYYSRLENMAFYNMTLVALFVDLGFILFTVLGSTIANAAMIIGVPAAFKAIPICYTVACIAAFPLLYFIVLAWQRKFWKMSFRIYFTMMTILALLFICFCIHWNLFGYSI